MNKKELFRIFEQNIRDKYSIRGVAVHNQKIMGVSGEKRQVDVVLKESGSTLYIECKYHLRPLSIEKIDEFYGKLKDLKASHGVLISKNGFTAGALARSKTSDIKIELFQEEISFDYEKVTIDTASFRCCLNNIIEISTEDVDMNSEKFILGGTCDQCSKGIVYSRCCDNLYEVGDGKTGECECEQVKFKREGNNFAAGLNTV